METPTPASAPNGPTDVVAARPAQPPFQAPAADTRNLWRAFRRRSVLALLLGVACAAVAAPAAWLYFPSAHYSARSLLYVASIQPQVLGGGEPRADFNNYKKTQQALAKSRAVLLAALKKPKVAELGLDARHADPVAWLDQEVKADYNTAPEILSLTLKGDDPEEIKAIVDAVTDAYLEEVVHKEDRTRLEHLGRLEKLYNDFDERLRSKRQLMTNLARTVGTNDNHTFAVQHEFALKRLHLAQDELMHFQFKRSQMEVELAALRAKEKAGHDLPVTEKAVAEFTSKDPLIEKNLARAAELETQLPEIERVAAGGRDGAAYREALAELETARRNAAARRQQLRPTAEREIRTVARRDLGADAAQLADTIALIKEHEKSLQALVERLTRETQNKFESSLEQEGLRDEIAQSDAMAKRVSGQIEMLRAELLAPARITKMEEATVLPTNDRKKRVLATAGAGLGVFFLAVFGVAWLEFRAQRVHSPEEVVQRLGLNLVGALPAPPDGVRGRLRYGADEGLWRYGMAESVDTTRTMLLHAAEAHHLRTVMVTSALPGEGKTSLAGQLAASLARAGRRTLLIDGDLRNPSAHTVFQLPEGPGLSEVVRGEADAESVVRPTPVDGLWMLPAGRWDPRTTEALARRAMRPALERLQGQFDFIIVDSSPVLAVVDPLLMGQDVGAAVFSVLHAVSRAPSIHAALHRLEVLGVRVLGAVVNGVREDGEGYGYGYGYGYGRRGYGRDVNQIAAAGEAVAEAR